MNIYFNSRKIFLAHSFVFICFSLSVLAQNEKTRLMHVGLIYPVSSNGLNAAEFTNKFSLHAISGISKNEIGVAISGVATVIKENAKGVQISGVANIIQDSADGVQIAGFMNLVRHNARGLPVAGFLNLSESAGAAQVAGFGNITRESVKGVQVSGFLNKSKDVNSQISGFINLAKNVKGVQIAGLINIADSSDYPIALLNFIKNGEKSIGITVDETATTIASFRSGGRVLYGILGAGYNFKSDNKSLYGFEAGLGAHIPVAAKFRVNTELVNLMLSDFKSGDYFKNTLRILPAFKIADRFEIFAGPSINYVKYSKGKGNDLISHYIWKKENEKDFKGLYLGFNVGVQHIF
ncbi:hypothetical protein [Dyadobacter frigoris]|uniref:Uncharacterized protein n=1 Tax=Dyadobacter frigoris TaxID=2576211 RepID=A0A4U6D829_9BACT|nr:hypothetical protein [Dyadobacter frigoris]TKT92916.1 hypothetical protein FDK13_09035 [Dyadobacter frigoris]GLU54304.1 hypothetical protein Dfri01_37650 [Dyadobacter frigoris]